MLQSLPSRDRRSLRRLVVVLTVLGTAGLGSGPALAQSKTPRLQPKTAPFEIGLIGDTGYSAGQDADLLAVRKSMASHPLAFVVHDGDVGKQGGPVCTDARLQAVRNVFDGFAAPFVYTPGDNEWTDCPNPSARLAAIRRIFSLSGSSTLGRAKMSVSRQSGTPENARWQRDGVYFATLNVPGPNGKGGPVSADLAWLNGTFDAAQAAGAAAVMVIQQDNPFSGGTPAALLAALKSRAKAFGRPVVLVNGDTHKHRVDQPWKDVKNFTRVETFAAGGARQWVDAIVDPGSPGVFTFRSVKAP